MRRSGYSDGSPSGPGTWRGSRRCGRHGMRRCGTTGSEALRLLARGQAAEHGNLLGIRAVAGSRDLEDEWQRREPRLVQQGAKSVLPDFAGADVCVPVAVGTEAGDGIVAVDGVDIFEAHNLVELIDRASDVGWRALVVTGRESVTGVEAHTHARIAQAIEHPSDLLEASADRPSQPGVVLDEQPCRLRVRAFQDLPQMLQDRWQTLLETRAFVRPGVEDHAIDAELVSRFEIAGQRALGAGPHGLIVTRQVDQVDGVEVKGRVAVFRRRLLEGRDAVLVELGRTPEARRGGVDLDRVGAHRLGALERQVQPPR